MWKSLLLQLLKVAGPAALEWGVKKLTPTPAPKDNPKVIPFPTVDTPEAKDGQ